jgi:hypothetical protein
MCDGVGAVGAPSDEKKEVAAKRIAATAVAVTMMTAVVQPLHNRAP